MASTAPVINSADLLSVKGMVALITGGGTGIGLMMTRALVDAGAAKVYIVGRRQEVLEQAVQSINKPDVVIPLAGDVTSKDNLASLVAQVEQGSGFLNLLVCNSGIAGPVTSRPPAAGASPPSLKEWREMQLAVPMEDYSSTFHVNTTAVWYTAMSFLELLDRGNKQGNLGWQSQVVITSSIGGFTRYPPGNWAYGQSKAAATHMTKQLASALPAWGIRVNCLAPGLFPSALAAPLVKSLGGDPDGAGDSLIPVDASAVPLARLGDLQDMAGTILYLVSRAGAYCNGSVMLIDGGRLGTFPATY